MPKDLIPAYPHSWVNLDQFTATPAKVPNLSQVPAQSSTPLSSAPHTVIPRCTPQSRDWPGRPDQNLRRPTPACSPTPLPIHMPTSRPPYQPTSPTMDSQRSDQDSQAASLPEMPRTPARPVGLRTGIFQHGRSELNK